MDPNTAKVALAFVLAAAGLSAIFAGYRLYKSGAGANPEQTKIELFNKVSISTNAAGATIMLCGLALGWLATQLLGNPALPPNATARPSAPESLPPVMVGEPNSLWGLWKRTIIITAPSNFTLQFGEDVIAQASKFDMLIDDLPILHYQLGTPFPSTQVQLSAGTHSLVLIGYIRTRAGSQSGGICNTQFTVWFSGTWALRKNFSDEASDSCSLVQG